jgi:hypothetical protein
MCRPARNCATSMRGKVIPIAPSAASPRLGFAGLRKCYAGIRYAMIRLLGYLPTATFLPRELPEISTT